MAHTGASPTGWSWRPQKVAAELERARLTFHTQKYTHVAMVDIIDAYNLVHPRA